MPPVISCAPRGCADKAETARMVKATRQARKKSRCFLVINPPSTLDARQPKGPPLPRRTMTLILDPLYRQVKCTNPPAFSLTLAKRIWRAENLCRELAPFTLWFGPFVKENRGRFLPRGIEPDLPIVLPAAASGCIWRDVRSGLLSQS